MSWNSRTIERNLLSRSALEWISVPATVEFGVCQEEVPSPEAEAAFAVPGQVVPSKETALVAAAKECPLESTPVDVAGEAVAIEAKAHESEEEPAEQVEVAKLPKSQFQQLWTPTFKRMYSRPRRWQHLRCSTK